MKKLFLLMVLMVITGCTAKTIEKTGEYVLTGDLADCKIYDLSTSNGNYIEVVRCPNSSTSTTYRQGKIKKTTVVIDGVEYVKNDK